MKSLNDIQEDICVVLKCILSIVNPWHSHKELQSEKCPIRF